MRTHEYHCPRAKGNGARPVRAAAGFSPAVRHPVETSGAAHPAGHAARERQLHESGHRRRALSANARIALAQSSGSFSRSFSPASTFSEAALTLSISFSAPLTLPELNCRAASMP